VFGNQLLGFSRRVNIDAGFGISLFNLLTSYTVLTLFFDQPPLLDVPPPAKG